MSLSAKASIDSSQAFIGVIGGGQLALMLVEAAKVQNKDVVVQTSSTQDPAAMLASHVVLSDPYRIEGTEKLLNYCSHVTFENEWVDTNNLKNLEPKGVKFFPSLTSLEPLVNKISQRQLLDKLNIPGPKWLCLSSDLISTSKLPLGWKFPIMAKSAVGGYDGKGNKVISDYFDLSNFYQSVNRDEWLIESWVNYEKELALVASRDKNGIVRTFPLVETSQHNRICNWVIAPANIDHQTERMTYNIASSLLRELNYVGVIAIEFFYGPNGLLVNEIAPRTHNSAHYTIEACKSSQFDHQISIVSGTDVPSSDLSVPGALMVNLLGLSDQKIFITIEERLAKLNECNDFYVHWYNKNEEKPGRKLGHVTVLLSGTDDSSRRAEASSALEKIRAIWPMDCSHID